MKFEQYVRATYIEKTAAAYQAKGYHVVISPIDVSYPFEARRQSYDIVGTKEGKQIAIEVVAWPKLAQEGKQIALLRQQAKKEGFDEFRLVVVREPRQIPVNVEGIGQELLSHLQENLLDELAKLSDGVRVINVEKIKIDSISIKPSGIRAAGEGLVIVDIHYDLDGDRFWEDDYFPLQFDVELDQQLHLKCVHELVADTSSFLV